VGGSIRTHNGHLKILHALASIDRRHGGPSRSVVGLCDALSRENGQIHLLTQIVDEDRALLDRDKLRDVHLHIIRTRSLLNYDICSYLRTKATIIDLMCEGHVQLLHGHGIWTPFNHNIISCAYRLKVPCIVSPRGMLEPWALAYKRWKKSVMWWLYQRRDLLRSTVFHATSEQEAKAIRMVGIKQPIAVIPNGVVAPKTHGCDARAANSSIKRILFLSRLHPKKGVLNLIEAWKSIGRSDWKLCIAGPGEAGHIADVLARVRSYRLNESVEIVGEVRDEAKWSLMRESDLLVLPTFSENFGLVVGEALACGVPVITTKGAPWKDLEAHKCGWWIDIGVEPLISALEEAMSLTDEERCEMGRRGRGLMENKYTWKAAAKKMEEVYKWMINGGDRPECVV